MKRNLPISSNSEKKQVSLKNPTPQFLKECLPPSFLCITPSWQLSPSPLLLNLVPGPDALRIDHFVSKSFARIKRREILAFKFLKTIFCAEFDDQKFIGLTKKKKNFFLDKAEILLKLLREISPFFFFKKQTACIFNLEEYVI